MKLWQAGHCLSSRLWHTPPDSLSHGPEYATIRVTEMAFLPEPPARADDA